MAAALNRHRVVELYRASGGGVRMRLMRLRWLLILTLALTPVTLAQAPATTRAITENFCNPLDVLLADPFIFHERETYYLYGTAADDGLLVWTSKNLADWQLKGYAFKRSPESWSRHSFWAPELFAHDG